MTAGYQALTEKEKETLRLLIGGHDAKSIARALGLSIHTVNERLRDARRKMAVTSSREAARLMRAAEGRDPNSIVDKQLGDALDPVASPHPDTSTAASALNRPAVWIVGGSIMLLLTIALFAMLGASPVAEAPSVAVEASKVAESESVASARNWLSLVDASNWKQSWLATGRSFRELNTLERWQTASLSVRVPLGAALSRTLVSDDNVPTPPQGNMVVKFKTSFAGKAEAVETVALVREDGTLRVVGYYID